MYQLLIVIVDYNSVPEGCIVLFFYFIYHFGNALIVDYKLVRCWQLNWYANGSVHRSYPFGWCSTGQQYYWYVQLMLLFKSFYLLNCCIAQFHSHVNAKSYHRINVIENYTFLSCLQCCSQAWNLTDALLSHLQNVFWAVTFSIFVLKM
jgi:hypothetical protein